MKCHYCLTKLTEETVTRDHVIPKSKGGGNHAGNIVYACKSCNGTKKDTSYEEFTGTKFKSRFSTNITILSPLPRKKVSVRYSETEGFNEYEMNLFSLGLY